MGLGNGNAKSGNKGSNHNYEHRNLLSLGEIARALGPIAGVATEATLISVLDAIMASDQDIEILLVRDTGAADVVVQQITNYETGVPVVTYKDVNGAPYVPVGPLEYLDPSAVLNLVLSELITLNTGGQLTLDATLVATNALLTTMDAVLDNILLDTTGIVADTNTLSTPSTGLATSITRITSIGAAQVAAGKRRVSFFNSGAVDVNIGSPSVALKPGEVVTFVADGLRDTLAAIDYNALTGEILITTVG